MLLYVGFRDDNHIYSNVLDDGDNILMVGSIGDSIQHLKHDRKTRCDSTTL